MKKSFLIVGALGTFLATNGYAVQSGTVVVTYTCPAGCELETFVRQSGITDAYCRCSDGTSVNPTVTIENPAPSPSEIQQVMSQSVLNQAAIENAQKQNKVSVRSATVMPKMTKKIVYEEIVSDDAE